MKKIIKVLLTTLCLCLITGCGARDKNVNLEKTGEKYSTDNGVSFYYPSDYTINVDAKDVTSVQFIKDNNTLYYKVFKDDTDNIAEDKDELYSGLIEQSGANDVEVSKPVVDSGLEVYQYRLVMMILELNLKRLFILMIIIHIFMGIGQLRRILMSMKLK